MVEHYLDRLARTINENWDCPALTDFYLTEDGSAQDTSRGNHYTYGEMYMEIMHVCDIFQTLGLKQGDHIAICGANSAHWAIAYLAIAAYQGVAVTILHSQSPENIAYQIDFSDAKALFVDADLWEELSSHRPILDDLCSVISLENWQIILGKEIPITNYHLPFTNRDCHFSTGDRDNLAMICFTSGSTGKAKGVMLSYRSLSNNIYDTLLVYPHVVETDILSLFPFGHMAGFNFEFLAQLCFGKNIVLFREEKSPVNIHKAYQIVKPYMLAITPSLMEMMVVRYKEEFLDLLYHHCKYIIMGAAKMNESIFLQVLQKGIKITNALGLSEMGAIITGATSAEYKFPSCGRVLDGNFIKITENGEILVKGENVMLGYYKDPEATAAKIDSDGWLHTGDKGHLDEDGYLYVEGRMEQDIIVLPNGENIRPDNIESLVNALPEVSESIVLARDGKLVAIVVPQITNHQSQITNTDLRRMIMRKVNPSLPLFSQLYDVEITDTPLAKTEKQTLKRYLYK